MLPHNDSFVRAVNAHYGHSEYGDRIRRFLEARNLDLDHLTVDDLAPVDHLHGGALAATLHLAALAGIDGNQGPLRVADLGGGIGGPARTLAAKFGCSVDVVDLTEEFCRIGAWLTGLTRLDGLIKFYHGSALQTPLPAGAYDVVWMQNSAMNIEDRGALYAEVRRLLRPGGRYAFQEVMAGPNSPVYYPMNWASTPGESFLRRPDEVHRLVSAAGFRQVHWIDHTEEVAAEIRQRVSPPPGAPPRPVYVLDAHAALVNQNAIRNRDEDRTVHYVGVFEKTPSASL